ncbi:MAG: OB-fold domain-containing protein [Candidatus Rokubacteria bacterium]|nr:OB-fold domain-containing protein [Candidatus Rokubacteria bacterium]MBI3825685.1 OB-fold domain-containing protein [Candidatus Rokubacteria bacterium]
MPALAGRRCAECGRLSVAASACPFCGAVGGQSVELSGRGRLQSFTIIRIAPARYAAEAPYAVGLVALDEGATITARVSGAPESLTLGQAVTLASVDARCGPVFQPA